MKTVRRVNLYGNKPFGGKQVSIGNQKRIAQKLTVILTFLGSTISVGLSQNLLSIVRTDLQTLEVRLNNTDNVAGLQFSLRSSGGVTLSDFRRAARTSSPSLIVASYQLNDSTVNVVILGSNREFLGRGAGSLAKLTYATKGSSGENSVIFASVLLAGVKAESLQVSVENLRWASSPIFAGESQKSFQLGQNYPNPFNPSTTIAYSLNTSAQVRLSVYDVTGREIVRLVDQYQFAGNYNYQWNSSQTSAGLLPSGVYFARLQVNNESVTSKMILAK
jgi:hypothetical protein